MGYGYLHRCDVNPRLAETKGIFPPSLVPPQMDRHTFFNRGGRACANSCEQSLRWGAHLPSRVPDLSLAALHLKCNCSRGADCGA